MTTDYGTDVTTFAGVGCDLDPTFGLVSGPRVVAEHVARGLVGVLRSALNGEVDASTLRIVTAAVERVATEDERVLAASVVVTRAFTTSTLTASVQLDLIEDETFTLVLAVSAVGVEMILEGLS